MFDDGRIVLGGVSTYNGVPSTAGVVLTVDGDIDLNLSTSIAPMTIDQRQSDILIESDGDIVMSGGFQVKNADDTEVSRYIARFDGSTGELDSTLIGNLRNGSITTAAFSIAQQSDGRLIVGGPTVVNGTSWPRIGRLAADGGADTSSPTFATNVGADLMGHPYDIAVRSDDGVWVGGGFSGGVRLLGSDGTPVAVGEANAAVRAVLNHADDSVLLGGDFTTFTASSTATSANRLVALNADGTPDSTFNANMGDGANGDVRSLSVQSDGKILVGGAFTEFAGVAVDGVARLNADGTPDTAFNTAVSGQDIFGAQSDPRVVGIGVQPEGGIILFGYLRPEDADGNALSPGLARLSADGVLDPTFNADCPEPESPPTESVPEPATPRVPGQVPPWPEAIANADGSVTVSWAEPFQDGAGPITNYRVVSQPTGGSCVTSPFDTGLFSCVITGLEPDLDYLFEVFATNGEGEGPGQMTQQAVRIASPTPTESLPATPPSAGPDPVTNPVEVPRLPVTGTGAAPLQWSILLSAFGALLAATTSRRGRDVS